MGITCRPCIYIVISCLWALFFANSVHAEEQIISANLADGKTVTAEFRQAKESSRAVLILHGFLQTRNYLTVSNLADSAFEAGYTVLLPTLSLGVSERKRSLQCDAIHSHTFSEDVAEIDFWMNWLKKKGYDNVVVIGHSFGSLQLLGYLIDYPSPQVTRFIGTSLLDVSRETSKEKFRMYVDDAMTRIKNNDGSLGEYAMSYCKKYMAPAAAYMSYASWTRKSILDSVNNLKIPVSVVLGSKDKRLDPEWKDDLTRSGVSVVMVDGANHFFSGGQEFDFLDVVQELLK